MAGLAVDDILWAIRDVRRDFKLRKPIFELEQIEREPMAENALNEIIEATKKRYGLEICSKKHPLLEELGPEIYAEAIQDSTFLGFWRLSHSHVDRVLRKVFEIALQTLVQLPARHPKIPRAKDTLVTLASQFSKLAEKADLVVRTDKRIEAYLASTGAGERLRLLGLSTELRWGAEMLRAASCGTRILKLSVDSPNPQVSFAMYLVGWIESCTGSKHYKHLETLADAAFAAANVPRNPWVDRLEIEMNRKMKKRRRWVKMISAKP